MIKSLTIKNLILIEHAEISFENGFTVVTGETGAGKTAFIQALRLIMGERGDSTKVRKGCEKAFIQATFEFSMSKQFTDILSDAGIDLNEDEDLILSREILASGKSRAFIDAQVVSLTTLQKLSGFLIDCVSQHEQITLKSPDNQRNLLDQYIDLDVSSFQTKWDEEKNLEKELERLQDEASTNTKPLIEEKLEELDKLQLQEGEEKNLFEEYTLLCNSQEILAATDKSIELTDEAINACVQIKGLLDAISRYSSSLNDGKSLGEEAYFQLAELRSLIESFSNKIETDPNRLTFLEERLSLINKLKKKYGDDLHLTKEKLLKQLERLNTLDEQIAQCQIKLASSRERTKAEVALITQKRELGAKDLAKGLSLALQSLNIPHGEVSIELDKIPRCSKGEDIVTFYLRANLGEKRVMIKDSTSGGELSRLLFSLKILLAEKCRPLTMIFDEIDANVGGETAATIGLNLQNLSKKRQVFCITHFPQVARYGNHHLRVYKEEKLDRTSCKIEALSPKTKEIELLRMLGGANLIKH